ncbi:MAG: Clp protease N-terminal domain-containing protein, partial [Bacteroidota bacterium]
MEAKFSQRLKDVITFSREEALRLGHDYLGPEHLLLGIIREGEGMAVQILTSLGLDLMELRRNLESMVKTNFSKPVSNLGQLPLIKQTERALKITYLEARLFKSEWIETEHLLLSILKVDDNVAATVLNRYNVNYDIVKRELDLLLANPNRQNPDIKNEMPGNAGEEDGDDESSTFGSAKKPVDPKSKTPVLDNFGRDLTRQAEDGKLDPIVGREKEIE